MKKIKYLILTIACLVLFVSCGSKSKESVKKYNEIEITLTTSFKQTEQSGIYCTYESKNMIVLINRESINDVVSAYGSDMTLKQYCQKVIELNNKTVLGPYSGETIYYCYSYYTSTVDGKNYKYMLVCMRNDQYFYTINFATLESKFDDLNNDMLKYARSITISNINTEE